MKHISSSCSYHYHYYYYYYGHLFFQGYVFIVFDLPQSWGFGDWPWYTLQGYWSTNDQGVVMWMNWPRDANVAGMHQGSNGRSRCRTYRTIESTFFDLTISNDISPHIYWSIWQNIDCFPFDYDIDIRVNMGMPAIHGRKFWYRRCTKSHQHKWLESFECPQATASYLLFKHANFIPISCPLLN